MQERKEKAVTGVQVQKMKRERERREKKGALLVIKAFGLVQQHLDETDYVLNVESLSAGYIRLCKGLGVFDYGFWTRQHHAGKTTEQEVSKKAG